MIKKSSYTQEFKEEAINMALGSDLPLNEVAVNLGIKYKTLYNWMKKAMPQVSSPQEGKDKINLLEEEVKKLNKELKRTRQERDILKKAAAYFASQK